MKKNQFNYSRMAAAIVIIATLACSTAWIRPSFSRTEKVKAEEGSTTPGQIKNVDSTVDLSEEGQLIQQLESDGLINQVKGFVVEKKQNMLFVNGAQLPDNVAGKYISTLKKDELRIQVYPFMERLKQHPDVSFLQLLLPVMLSSPCVDYTTKKPGC